jgi:hypothetical protein
MIVTEGWDPDAPAPNRCPSCDEPDFGASWPPEPARLLLNQAFSLRAEGPEEMEEADEAGGLGLDEVEGQELGAVRAFLVATALDVILEWILKAAANYLPEDSPELARLAEPVHEASLTTEERLDSLEQLSGIRLHTAAAEQEEPELPGWWRELRTRRDRFVHSQDMRAFDDLTEEGLAETARMAVKVLAHVNNSIW